MPTCHYFECATATAVITKPNLESNSVERRECLGICPEVLKFCTDMHVEYHTTLQAFAIYHICKTVVPTEGSDRAVDRAVINLIKQCY